MAKKFKNGDIRNDGHIFWQYHKRKDGSKREVWLKPESYQKARESSARSFTARWKKNPLKHRDQQKKAAMIRKSKDPIKFAAKQLYNSALQRSRKSNLDFDLTREWIFKKVSAGICEVSKLPFHFDTSWKQNGRSLASPFIPSIDKKCPKKGYTKKNCQIVCYLYNTCKGPFSHGDVIKLAHALVKIS
jgi:hypothetical protein